MQETIMVYDGSKRGMEELSQEIRRLSEVVAQLTNQIRTLGTVIDNANKKLTNQGS